MNKLPINRTSLTSTLVLSTVALSLSVGTVYAITPGQGQGNNNTQGTGMTKTGTTNPATTDQRSTGVTGVNTMPSGNGQTAVPDQHLTNIQSRGDSEIGTRNTTLSGLLNLISSSTKLSAADKTYLTAEVNTTIAGLAAISSTLKQETTATNAQTDVKNIFSEFRVYAFLVPKIHIISVADGQQLTEAKIAIIATKLQTRITAAKTAGKDVTALQAKLDDLNAKVTAAQAISVAVEQAVLPLEPSDYNSDHTLLKGYHTQLKTAHTDNTAALADAQFIASGLKTIAATK